MFFRRISSNFPICDTSDVRCVVNENMQIIAVFRRSFPAVRPVTVASKIIDREVNLRIQLHISREVELVVPTVFRHLIGAKIY